MTGRENLRYTARLNGIPDKESNARITELLARVGLPEAGESPVETYSRGMRQRLGLADVLVKDPSVVILDEPTTSIDPVGVVEVLELVRSLARDHGVSVLLSSHLLHQVQQVCDRIAIFVAGDVVAMGTVAEIAAQPAAGRQVVAMDIGAEGDQDVGRGRAPGRARRDRGRPSIPRIGGCWTVTAPAEVRPAVLQALHRLRATRHGWCATGAWSWTRSTSATSPPAARPRHGRRRHDRRCGHDHPRRRRPMVTCRPPVHPRRLAGHRVARVHGAPPERALHRAAAGAGSRRACSPSTPSRAPSGTSRAQIPSTITGPASVPVFPLLFTTSPGIPGISGQSFPSFAGLVALLGPVLGIAFGFDAISSERSEGTLPRLVSQPIHRDDVINGKFVAGLAVITMILGAVIVMLVGRGHHPAGHRARRRRRAPAHHLVPGGGLYVAFWLALATLASVVFRRAATAALVVIAIWLVLTFFGSQIVSVVAGILRPVPANADRRPRRWPTPSMVAELGRLSPITLFTEMTQALLNPLVQSLDPFFQDPTGRAFPTILPFGQSLLLIWPQVVLLVAGTVVCFAAAYVSFMRQEIRA